MAIIRFTKQEFESSLPEFRAVGIVQGEECYIIQPFPQIPVGLFIRSSVDRTGRAASTGEDSIRVLWCDLLPDGKYNIIGNKGKAYTTRVKGWEGRLIVLMDKLANAIRFCLPCPKCAVRLTPWNVKNDKNGNAGRTYVSCSKCRHPDTGNTAVFYWCEDEEGIPLDLPADLAPRPVTAALPGCPQCGRADTFGRSHYAGPKFYCFPNRGGCGNKFDEPTTSPRPTTPPAPAYSGPLTVEALLQLIQDYHHHLLEAKTGDEVLTRVRNSPPLARLASFKNRFNSKTV